MISSVRADPGPIYDMVMDAALKLHITRISRGRVYAVLEDFEGAALPDIELRFGGERVAIARNDPDTDNVGALIADIPGEVLTDGVSVLTFHRIGQEEVLANIPIVAGQIFEDDLHSEVALLRVEVDRLKATLRDLLRGKR